LIFIKFNLIYWFEYWFFDVLRLTNIEIYLYFTIYEMIDFDVELDSYRSRFHVVKWTSRNETLRESFSRTLTLRSLLKRSMIEKYSSKSIDDKRLISIKSNLIYWFEYWLFDVLQLTSIEIYLYFTIYEMNSFDVELDSYLNRFHVVRWISRDETLRESFSRTFVLKSFAHFVIRSLRIWAWSLNRWVRLIED
jgi:hypothetical protein